MNKVKSVAPSTLDDLVDDTDGNDNDTEMEELLKTVKRMNYDMILIFAALRTAVISGPAAHY